jgi:predicted nucleotidyltransferase
VRSANASKVYLFTVRRVLVFGSYLSDREQINDIDVAVELVDKIAEPDKRVEAYEKKAREAHRAGRHFGTYLAELSWARDEVLLFLKSRSRSISLHSIDDAILKQTKTMTVFKAAN